MGNEHSKTKDSTKNGKIPEKHENGSVNGISATITPNGLEVEVNGDTIVKQNGGPHSLSLSTESTDYVIVDSDCKSTEAPVISEIPETTIPKEEEAQKPKEGKVRLFGKMFKKKAEPPADVETAPEKETLSEDQTDVSPPATEPQPETANPKQDSETLTEPEVTLDPGPEEETAPESDHGNSQPVESQEDGEPEENPVMNFFKTLVTPTKATKKETAAPDAPKDQSQQETPPAATTTVAQVSEPPAAPKGMSIPPPPPPEPPKMEIKAEPAAKPVKPTPKEEPKAAAKAPEASKGKSAKDTFSKFFRPKTIKETPQPAVEVEVQPVVEVQETPVEVPEPVVEVQSENKVEPHETPEEAAQPVVEEQKADPSKAGTLEAAPKPEPPPPVQEEKKTASKSSFLSLFKPKVLLDHMTTKVQAASTSGVRLLRKTAGVAADPKKATPAPAAAAEAAATVKAKEEPKAAAAKSAEAVVDSKPASAASPAGDDAASAPKKLEKRNSIQLFFKILGQKRNSTDAGVQTEPVTVAQAAEKAK